MPARVMRDFDRLLDNLAMNTISIHPLEPRIFNAYGWVLGTPPTDSDSAPRFLSPATDFWSAHAFDTGAGGEAEVLWVIYRSRERTVTSLEAHRLTQQAIIPLTGSIIQIVARPASLDGRPDLSTLAAFRVEPGQGICMRPGCWHTTRVSADEVRCAMLTRRSTTIDLVAHLAQGASAGESAVVEIPTHAWAG